MDNLVIGLLGIAALFVVILSGLNVMVALGLVGAAGLWLMMGFHATTTILGTIFYEVTHSFNFSVIPMFLLMGYFTVNLGLGEDLFEAATKWLGRLPGGLAIATTGAAAAFGGPAGTSVGTCTLFTKLALPEMLKRGYDKRLASASIAISGALAVLIPPSALIVVFCILTDSSIGKALLAGTIPGIVFAILLCLTIMIIAMIRPSAAPRMEERATWGERFWSLRLLGPLIIAITLIIGGLYAGIFTPAEAGAAGAVITLIMAMIRRRTIRGLNIPQALIDTVQTSAMIFAIIISALVFARFISFSGLPQTMVGLLTEGNLNKWVVVAAIVLLYTILGMLMDAPALLAVTLPVVYPLMTGLGFDPAWLAVFVVVLAELGAVTPPVGMNCFVVKGAAGDLIELEDVFAGLWPFWITCFVMLVLLCAFPQMATFLPDTMR